MFEVLVYLPWNLYYLIIDHSEMKLETSTQGSFIVQPFLGLCNKFCAVNFLHSFCVSSISGMTCRDYLCIICLSQFNALGCIIGLHTAMFVGTSLWKNCSKTGKKIGVFCTIFHMSCSQWTELYALGLGRTLMAVC